MSDPVELAAPQLSDMVIEHLLDRAVDRLIGIAPGICVIRAAAAPAERVLASASPAGWCEIGTLRDAEGRFWYRVLWHPESGTGRMLRERPKAARGVLGETL